VVFRVVAPYIVQGLVDACVKPHGRVYVKVLYLVSIRYPTPRMDGHWPGAAVTRIPGMDVATSQAAARLHGQSSLQCEY
jgi:hypothetical protein